jgi:cytochrome c peroxidase
MKTIRLGLSLAFAGMAVGLAGCAGLNGPAPLAGAPVAQQPQDDPHGSSMLAPSEDAVAMGDTFSLMAVAPNFTMGQKAFTMAVSDLYPKVKTNGRSCASCHFPDAGFTMGPAGVKAKYAANPNDPLFAAEMADAGPDVTQAEIHDHLLNRALIRVNLTNPYYDPKKPGDMYNPKDLRFWRSVPTSVNSAAANSCNYKNPVTGKMEKGAVMWDLREPSVEQQAVDASHGHAQGTGTFPASLGIDIGEFERKSAAVPASLYKAKLKLPKLDPKHSNPADPAFGTPIFNPATVKQDFFATVDIQPGTKEWRGMLAFVGTPQAPHCIVCHNMPETLAGGTVMNRDAHVSSTQDASFPVVHLRLKDAKGVWHNCDTKDPGCAVTTGRYEDLNTFKVPQLRGIKKFGRYFHDNRATTLGDVMDHYQHNFKELFKDMKGKDRNDIEAFLNAL